MLVLMLLKDWFGTSLTGYSRDLYGQLRQVGLELPFNRNQKVKQISRFNIYDISWLQ